MSSYFEPNFIETFFRKSVFFFVLFCFVFFVFFKLWSRDRFREMEISILAATGK